MNESDFERLSYRVGEVFTPAAPIAVAELFAGRKQQVAAVIDAINQPGQHAVLYGERGVGKTSFANVLAGFWQRDEGIIAPRISCLSSDSFASVWARALKEIQTTQKTRAGFRSGEKPKPSNVLKDLEPGATVTHDVLREVLTPLGSRLALVLFFDEFDVLSPTVRRDMAETVKLFSDYNVPATLVLVGVADSVTDLLHDHLSIERALVQVRMPRMNEAELKQIVETGLKHLGMAIDGLSLSRISHLSLGLPYYTHLIALHATRQSLNRAVMLIDSTSIDLAINSAVSNAQQSLVSGYALAVASSQRKHLYRQVLAACAQASTDETGYFAPAAVREPLSLIMSKSYDVPSYIRHLNEFASDKRGCILERKGTPRSLRFRFANPLMQPYVLLKARSDGLVIYMN
ncbi:MAG TPA: ATP-binding protein [Candidatus Baltobacteraceae bacterium]|jgi:Cdc6-like AAA superfamily ATPase